MKLRYLHLQELQFGIYYLFSFSLSHRGTLPNSQPFFIIYFQLPHQFSPISTINILILICNHFQLYPHSSYCYNVNRFYLIRNLAHLIYSLVLTTLQILHPGPLHTKVINSKIQAGYCFVKNILLHLLYIPFFRVAMSIYRVLWVICIYFNKIMTLICTSFWIALFVYAKIYLL